MVECFSTNAPMLNTSDPTKSLAIGGLINPLQFDT